jgi:hypothetical protein
MTTRNEKPNDANGTQAKSITGNRAVRRDPTMNKSGGCDEEWWQARRPWSTSATSENEQFKVDIPGNLFREVNPTVFCRA